MRRAYAALEKRGLPLAVNQMRYSLLSREIETNGVLETARELGVTITAYTPLGRGLLSGKYHKNPELLQKVRGWRRGMMQRNLERTRPLIQAMEEIAGHYQATVAQIALNWVIHFNGDSVVTIPGATKVRQAEEAAGAMRFEMTKEEMSRLDELSRKL
jgi:aryl-alcohol dehydrogenase-like predicted oxidoreductase